MDRNKESDFINSLCIVKVLEDYPGGVSVQILDLPPGVAKIPGGTLIGEEEEGNGKFHVVKTAKLLSSVYNTSTQYRVYKNHLFKVGDIITSRDIPDCKAFPITNIDNSDYFFDIFTVGTSLGGSMPAYRDIIFCEVASVDPIGGASVLKYTPEAVLLYDIDVFSGGNAFGSAMIRGSVKESLLPYFVNSDLRAKITERINFYRF